MRLSPLLIDWAKGTRTLELVLLTIDDNGNATRNGAKEVLSI